MKKYDSLISIWWLQMLILAFGICLLCANENRTFELIINQYHHPILDTLCHYATYLGDGLIALSICLFLGFKLKSKSVPYLFSIASSALMAQVIKRICAPTLRPIEYYKQITEIYTVPFETMLHFNSFPSGHTSTAFASAIVLSYYFKNSIVTSVLLFLACLVAFTRVYLMQHFIHDVVGGMLLAMLISNFAIVYHQHIYTQKQINS
jgi:membrane-associated phospholipid phosphatase